MWELLLSPGSDGNSDQNQRWLMSDTFTEVTSIYYGEVGGGSRIHSRFIMEETVMTVDVCHQQV